MALGFIMSPSLFEGIASMPSNTGIMLYSWGVHCQVQSKAPHLLNRLEIPHFKHSVKFLINLMPKKELRMKSSKTK